eukprot:TRINITY_DN16927_c0_g1_i2.p1 TRINITY_DN16927_c0_g1~~TRINITY_DN16927_c0_g1_i2.p1  ORF type:complete len:528 (+),score=43.27 TRINITY_DN16927_c0_g1_i2:83-1666(+)
MQSIRTRILPRLSRHLATTRWCSASKLQNRLPPVLWRAEDEFPAQKIKPWRRGPASAAHFISVGWQLSLRIFRIAFSSIFLPETLQASRSIIAGSMVMAQLVRTVGQLVSAGERFRLNVLFGSEAPLKSVKQRVIRLCGKESDVTYVSLMHHGEHILPVYERQPKWYQKQLVTQLMHINKHWQWKPIFWCVENNEYGSSIAWKPLAAACFSKHFLVQDINGNNLLIIEADATDTEDTLNLGDECNDLNLDDASQAFQQIQAHFKRQNKHNVPFRVLRVFLGDSMQKVKTGGGPKLRLRERVNQSTEVDVFVDSRTVIVAAIVQWAKTLLMQEKFKEVVFDTDDLAYFAKIRNLMAELGIHLIDVDQISTAQADYEEKRKKLVAKWSELEQDNKSTEEVDSMLEQLQQPQCTPRLVYHTTTNRTVMRVKNLLAAQKIDLNRCCVLVDKVSGQEEMDKLKYEIPVTHGCTHVICSSVLWDEMFRQVRVWARLGNSAEAIQAELDCQLGEVISMAKTALHRKDIEEPTNK